MLKLKRTIYIVILPKLVQDIGFRGIMWYIKDEEGM